MAALQEGTVLRRCLWLAVLLACVPGSLPDATAALTQNATTGVWDRLPPIPTYTCVRGQEAVRGRGNTIYVAPDGKALWEYNVTSSTWSQLASRRSNQGIATAVAGRDGRIYVMGGYGPGLQHGVVQVYTPSTDTWSTAAPMPIPRSGVAATLGPDGKIYVIGGDAVHGSTGIPSAVVEAYNPATNKWTTAAPLPYALDQDAAAVGPNGRIYVIGGSGPTTESWYDLRVYSVHTRRWTLGPTMPHYNLAHGVATGPDGLIYVMGGGYTAQPTDPFDPTRVDAYDVRGKQWRTEPPAITARYLPAVVAGSDGRIYAIGGEAVERAGHGPCLQSMDAYTTAPPTLWTVD
jgi:hypothetical protein